MTFNKSLILNISKICLSSFLIIYILLKMNLEDIVFTFKTANVYFVLLAFCLQFVNLPIRAYKWKILLSVQGIQVPLKTLVSISLVGAFFNNFLPTSMGGDLIRAHEISKYSNQTVKSVSTIILQRLTGLIAIIVYCVIGIIIGFNIPVIKNLAVLIGLLALISLIFIIILLNLNYFKNINIIRLLLQFDSKNIIKKTYYSLEIYKHHKKECIEILIISLFAEFIVIIYFYIITLSLHQNISMLYFFIFIPIISVIEMLPISINGIGVRESAFLYFFTQIGILDYIAVSVSLLYYAQKVGIGLIGGGIYGLRRRL